MKVSIQLDVTDGDQGEQSLVTSMDYLNGKVLLCLQRADAVSRVTLTLQGKLVSSVVSPAINPLDGESFAVDDHKLFKISQTVFPPLDVPIPSKGFSLSKGITPIPFKFRLPVLSSCHRQPHDWIKHLTTTLPPSFKFQSTKNDGSASVEYYLKVEVIRPGRFKSNLAVKRSINFMPLDPALPPPMMEPTRIKSTRDLKYELPSSPSASSPSSPLGEDSRTVTLAATLPAPAVLRIGSSLPLGISIIAKEGMSTTTPSLFIRSLTLNLLTETTVNVGPNLRTWTSWKEMISTDLEIQLNPDEEQEIPKDLWKDAIIPKSLLPSFTTCSLMQQHFVVILVGLSYGKEGSILNMKTMINVELHSGVERQRPQTSYGNTTPEEEDNEDQVAFVPWRVGSERHMGILGRRDSRTDNGPPPPY